MSVLLLEEILVRLNLDAFDLFFRHNWAYYGHQSRLIWLCVIVPIVKVFSSGTFYSIQSINQSINHISRNIYIYIKYIHQPFCQTRSHLLWSQIYLNHKYVEMMLTLYATLQNGIRTYSGVHVFIIVWSMCLTMYVSN